KRVPRVLAWRAAEVPLVGLAKLEEKLTSYHECYLHTRFLLDRIGKDGAARLLRLLEKGTRFWEAASTLTGMDRAAFIAAADAASRALVDEMARAGGLEALRAALAATKSDAAARVAALQDFSKQNPKSPVAPFV